MKPEGLPSYIYHASTRAYLVLSADVYGRWNAGYHAWIGEDEAGQGVYIICGPVVDDAKSPNQAMQQLLQKIKQAKKWI